jgi:ankyrin repeat protein
MSIIKAGMKQVTTADSEQKPETLIGAVVTGAVKTLKQMLLKDPAAVNSTADPASGSTILHVAAATGYLRVVQTLISSGANVNTMSKGGVNPLHVCCRDGYTSVVALLLQAGATVDCLTKGESVTPLHLAAQEGHLEVMKLLMANGADVKKPDNKGCMPIHLAAEFGHFEVVSFLLAGNRAKVNQIDSAGATALHYAAANGSHPVVWRLIQRGASPNMSLPNGATPLFLAAQNGFMSVVRLLMDVEGVNVNATGMDASTGMTTTAAEAALRNAHTEVNELLVERMHQIEKERLEIDWKNLKSTGKHKGKRVRMRSAIDEVKAAFENDPQVSLHRTRWLLA